jgi:hypothetical protein
MQSLLKETKITDDRTLAKHIDEHNFKTITERILKKNKNKLNMFRTAIRHYKK